MSLLLVSCGRQKVKIPTHILGKEKMVPVLVELHIAEKIIAATRISFDSARIVYHSGFKKEILQKYDISVSQFDSSFVFYESNVELMADIYESVVDSLGARVSEEKLNTQSK